MPQRRFIALLLLLQQSWLFAETPQCRYTSVDRSLTVQLKGQDRFRYSFNKGGAINGIYDLQITPSENLIGKSFQGETTDRVIQWTYWNSRYQAPENPVGDGDKRANATMEGCYHEAATCEVLQTPPDSTGAELVFKSRIQHWFYANLDQHGTPDFETTSTYTVLEDGSLKLTRSVLRRPWLLKNILEVKGESKQLQPEALMICEHTRHGSMNSYFEAWSPFNRKALPLQRHAKGTFAADGYRFWKPAELGGWAMAHSEKQAVAIVFGLGQNKESAQALELSFNKLDLPGAELNILLPAIELTWPEHAALTQVLIIVPGSPAEVAQRANALAPSVSGPTLESR